MSKPGFSSSPLARTIDRAGSRTLALSLALCTSPLVAACDDAREAPIFVKVSTVRAPEAIAFRDALDGEWQTPAPTSPGSYEFEVRGPYVVSVVCNAGNGFIISTRQLARTPEDSRELDMACEELPLSDATITGKMQQAGSVAVSDARDFSDLPNWSFNFGVPAGTYDLIAFSDERLSIRPGLAVTDTLDVGTINITQGAALVPAALSVTNNAAGELLEAQVLVSTPRTSAGYIHLGPPATARVAPTELLTGDVRQSVTLAGYLGDSIRSARRDFRAGDPTSFTLPEPLAGLAFDTASGDLAATWTELPEHDEVSVSVSGTNPDDKAREHTLELSARFLAATAATGAAFDTAFPGYQPDWRPSYTREYSREVVAVRDADGERRTSTAWTLVNPEPPGQAQRTGQRPRSLPGTSPARRALAR